MRAIQAGYQGRGVNLNAAYVEIGTIQISGNEATADAMIYADATARENDVVFEHKRLSVTLSDEAVDALHTAIMEGFKVKPIFEGAADREVVEPSGGRR